MRVDHLSTNFTGGEISPRLYGRPDMAKYADSVKLARDVVVLQHGGVTRRPGSDDLGPVQNSAHRHRAVPFVFSVSDAYVLEWGNYTMRVWRDGDLVEASPGVPYSLATPYSADEVQALDFTQGADTMLLAHGSHAMRRLRRFGDARWVLDLAPFDPAPFDEVGDLPAVSVTLGATTGSTSATASGAAWLASDVGRSISYAGGLAEITAVGSSTGATVLVSSPFASTALPSGQWVLEGSPQTSCDPTDKEPVGKVTALTLAADGWRSGDVGKHVTLNGGLLRIEAVTSATVAQAKILTVLTADIAAEAGAWTLEAPVWNAVHGYPQTVTFHEQRTVAGGTRRYPQSIWGSRSGLYFDFTKGTADDHAYGFELGTDEINPVLFLSSNRNLLALTYGGEWTISGGVEKPLTPTNVRAMLQSKAGAHGVRPEQIDDDLFYVQRGAGRLRTLGYRIELGGYQSEEASTFSEHLTRPGLQNITYQQAPERLAWLLLGNGAYLGVTVSREQQLRAMTLCTAAGGGVVESQATIPEGGEDVTYQIVRRVINGATVRRMERMRWAAVFDSQRDSTPLGATITGLGHLEGATVGVVADDVDVGDFTVQGGQVTLRRPCDVASVGLRFVPRVKLLAPEFGTGMGAASGRKQMAGATRVLFQDTVGCSVNGQGLSFRELGEEVIGGSVEPFSGWMEVSSLGWAPDAAEMELSQPQAYPWTVLAVVRRITANPG
jgi:hypothetical protein